MNTPDLNDPSALKDDLQHTREELGETVDQLRDKLDVKNRARDAAHEAKHAAIDQARHLEDRAASVGSSVKDAATDDHGKPKPAVSAAGVGFVIALAALVIWLWRRK